MSDSWWVNSQHRDTLAYAALALIFSAIASGASILKQWPEDGWVRTLGTFLTNVLSGGFVCLLVWKYTVPDNIPYLLLAALSGGWSGQWLFDRLVKRTLGALFDPIDKGKNNE